MAVLYKILHNTGEAEDKEAGPPWDGRESDPSLSTSLHPRKSRSTIPRAIEALVMFLLGVMSAATFFLLSDGLGRRSSYENGFREEKILPASLIQLEQRQFLSPVDFRADGTEYLVTLPGETKYVGATNPEVDRAWEELLWGRYFSISAEEARKLWGPDYEMYYDREKSGYSGGFDMFHQLHCLNQIRQALHRDYYPEKKIHGPVHLDHCINHIRQAIQCWGSTAITPIKWFEGYHHGYVQSNMVHTCRRFEPIRKYVSERFNGSLQVPRAQQSIENDNAF